MNPKSYSQIAKDVKLLCINSEKFKTNVICVDFYVPIDEHFAALNVLASLMGHTSKNYKTFTSFNAKIESLYGADFDESIATAGEKVRIRFSIEIPDDRFSLDENKISEDAVDFLIDILSNPNCENEKFDEERSKWHALPFSEESYDLVYGGSGYFTDHRDDTNVLPYIENGYWWSTCYSYKNEGEPEVRVSANFDFALFDADMGRLYYYEYDS